jgi:hypothetical protein
MKSYFSSLKKQANSRAKESTLSVLGISNPSLRDHLGSLMDDKESFISGPVFEQMFGWEQSEVEMQALVESGLLTEKLVNALDSDANGRYAFKANWKPFKHQLKAWSDLLDDSAQSRVITSGTGSGKTECFMVPVLEDLLRLQKTTTESFVGVHALFLYPLNALINSQKERLNAWTKHFNGDIRFCLFNGNTPNKLDAKLNQVQKKNPHEVLSRGGMRDKPAQILVTNGTMLEYMLVRQADSPIIEQSKGKLRWIILDEAHTYVGSQAAELALQLRRVLQAFEVDPSDVRFIATSATIAGKDTEKQLGEYLAKLAGIDISQVKIIGGQRAIPSIANQPKINLLIDEIESIEKTERISKTRFDALCSSPVALAIRNRLTMKDSIPMQFDELLGYMEAFNLNEALLFRWLDLCTATSETSNSEAFLKLRAHYFQRMLQGLWCCIDPNCPTKKSTSLLQDWQFGYAFTSHRQICLPECGAPVLELAFCQDCSEPHLLGSDQNGKLSQWSSKVSDEFSLQDEGESDPEQDNDDEKLSSISSDNKVVFSGSPNKENQYQEIHISKDGVLASLDPGAITLSYYTGEQSCCCSCAYSGRGPSGHVFRRALLGAPFYSSNAVPTILEYCPDIEPYYGNESKTKKLGPNDLPGRGRRLITFTDSRQGTARMSIRMQQEAERSRLRGLVVKNLKLAIESKDDVNEDLLERIKDYESLPEKALEQTIEAFKSINPQLAGDLSEFLRQKKIGTQKVTPTTISWNDLAKKISNDQDVQNAMLTENKRLSPEVFDQSDGSLKLANMLLTREFARRPKRQNNLETQGLVKIVYPQLDSIKKTPEKWPFDLSDWKDFLKTVLDFYIRENSFTNIKSDWSKWIGMHFYPKTLLSPESKEEETTRVKKWPQVREGSQNQKRILKRLMLAA